MQCQLIDCVALGLGSTLFHSRNQPRHLDGFGLSLGPNTFRLRYLDPWGSFLSYARHDVRAHAASTAIQALAGAGNLAHCPFFILHNIMEKYTTLLCEKNGDGEGERTLWAYAL